MELNTNAIAFFSFAKVGLFPFYGEGFIINDFLFRNLDWEKVYQLSQEQSVQGLVLQGIEELKAKGIELNVPKMLLLQWIGEVQMIEQRNKEMNTFVADLIEKLRKEDIYAILVKGQGIAQCYEKPLWRSCGDIDLLLSLDNFNKTSSELSKDIGKIDKESFINIKKKHREYQIAKWIVELHGSMRTNLSRSIDKVIDRVQHDVFCGGNVRSWLNGNTHVFLPSPDNDVVFVFTHILQHLFFEGIGLRQICDWCRLIYTYKESLNHGLLESRIKAMGLLSEWKTFYNLASRYLGMPDLGGRLMVRDSKYDKKADKLMTFVLEVGNFGHNREVEWANGFKRRTSLIWHRITDTFKLSLVFPLDAPRFLFNYAVDGVRGLMRW
jgi:hypothetical protein